MRTNRALAIAFLASLTCSAALAQQPSNKVDVVEVVGLSCEITLNGPEVQGAVKNISDIRLPQIEIQEIFRDGDSRFVSTAKSFLEFDPLLPGQTSTFDGFGGNNPAITFVHIAIGLQGGPIIPSAGANFAHCR